MLMLMPMHVWHITCEFLLYGLGHCKENCCLLYLHFTNVTFTHYMYSYTVATYTITIVVHVCVKPMMCLKMEDILWYM